jgi:hypothetical protein
MNEAERVVLQKLLEAHIAFTNLSKQHPMDESEWVHSFHNLQRIIMSREAVRNNKDLFLNLENENK